MNNIVGQYISQLNDLTKPKQPQQLEQTRLMAVQKSTPDVSLKTPNQLLVPTQSWDWPVVTIGTVSDQQFRFADMMPLSSEPETLYSASSKSFSNNYRAFLDLIDVKKFPSNDLLRRSIDKIVPPTGNPANDPTPPGWTKVMIQGINRWKPIWDVPTTASKWKLDVETGTINNHGTIFIKLKNNNDPTGVPSTAILTTKVGGSATQLAETSQFEEVAVTARAWGQISISPGAWFDSSIIHLGKKYVSNEADFFGKDGILNCRVSAFYVAYQPTFKFSSPTPVKPEVLTVMSAAKDLLALGVQVMMAPPSGDSKSVSMRSISPDPVIVAVALETFT